MCQGIPVGHQDVDGITEFIGRIIAILDVGHRFISPEQGRRTINKPELGVNSIVSVTASIEVNVVEVPLGGIALPTW